MIYKYAYIILLNNQKPLHPDIIKKHVQYLAQLDVEKKLILSGPFTNQKSGSVIVYATSMDEAHDIAKRDPFVMENYKTYDIYEVEIANKNNHYLL